MVQSKDPKKKRKVKSQGSQSLCTVCGGHREERLVILIYETNGRWIMIKDVPASVCRLCGEKYFTPTVSERILTIAHEIPRRTETVIVPVVAFNAA